MPSWSCRRAFPRSMPATFSPSMTGRGRKQLIAERIEDGESRALTLRRIDLRGPATLRGALRQAPGAAALFGAPEVRLVDIAPPDGIEPHAPRLAIFADPWPGTVAVYVAAEGGGFRLATALTTRAVMGRLTAPLAAGPWGLFDNANAIEVELFGGALASLPDIDVFAGGNTAAVMTASGRYEVLQFAEAELTAPLRYRLTKLLRGQAGTRAGDGKRRGDRRRLRASRRRRCAASDARRPDRPAASLPDRPGAGRPRRAELCRDRRDGGR